MNILIVDDEKSLREQLIKYLSLENINAQGAEDAFQGLKMLKTNFYDLLLVDLKMPMMDGIEMIKKVREDGFERPIMMMSAHGETEDAVNAMKSGASDYIIKPFLPDELVLRIKEIVESYSEKNKNIINKKIKTREFIGENNKIKEIKNLVLKMNTNSSNILITGESGTGKEILARFIHQNSLYSDGPFVAINISSIPENLVESELFGYEKGAFTGASSRKLGYFELANNGTLFLDEIADASLSLQVKILRAIQEKVITRVGGGTEIPINVRIISATNKDLEDCVAKNTFREDLFYRLDVIHFHLPPLRDRKDDIILLSKYLTTSKGGLSITDDALHLLQNYYFKGNIRELENIIERALIFSDNRIVDKDNILLSPEFIKLNNENTEKSEQNKTLKDTEKERIIKALEENNGNRTHTALTLGISRRTLITKIEEYNL